jgi:ketosteroid isomerase-like protein
MSLIWLLSWSWGARVFARGNTILASRRLHHGEARACSGLTPNEHSGAEHCELPNARRRPMQTTGRSNEIERLERSFWQSLVERDADAATGLLAPEALMVSSHGTMRFDPAQYTKMLQDPKHGLLEYTLSDMDVLFPTGDIAIATYRAHQAMQMDGERMEQDVVDSSTWVRIEGDWKCVAHTESEVSRPFPAR